jgi:predicted transcriptional regulator
MSEHSFCGRLPARAVGVDAPCSAMCYNALHCQLTHNGMDMTTKENVSVRLEPAKREALDRLAESLDRDRSYLINEAVDAYLEAHAWQVEEIEAGLKDAEEGNFASDEEVARAFRRARAR